MPPNEAVITGLGMVSPIGIGKAEVSDSFRAGRSGIGPIRLIDPTGLPVQIAAEVGDFDAKAYVRPRKSLKVMARDTHLGVAASVLACQDANIVAGAVEPERFGVILGADRICNPPEFAEPSYRACTVDGKFDFDRWGTDGIDTTFPLSFLKVLPNMIASHVSIAHDARGPNNTIHQAGLSGLLAVVESARVIQRGMADVMIARGASSQMDPFDWVRHCVSGLLSTSRDDPTGVMRPFDAHRDGQVWGEGAAAFIVESRRHAEARKATILARVLGWASTCEPHNGGPPKGMGLERAMLLAVKEAGLKPGQLGHINAHGVSGVVDDPIEARAIGACFPDVPVTAPKSYFGNLGAAGGAMEMAASVLSFADGLVPPTLNYRHPDPRCPVHVIRDWPFESSVPTALAVNWTWIGQAVALVLGGPD
ncbi:MAG: beta-ketoacyl-[acyl-carrier-protein] synthase family protein [Planctomycetes bacterium]|nr:beta-ketoacyl-[acyl-carrier-protein] synthase family protein [Planctomycetota bacterium]